MLTVCTFLWADPQSPKPYTYDASYVHELKARVGQNLTVPHEFICVSDRRIEGVKTVPLDYTTHVSGTRFAKLMLFKPSGPLVGRRVLYLDLDAVVTGNLDPLVSGEDDLRLWRNPNFGQPGRAFYNTSIILHTCGTRPEFWTEFDKFKTWPMLRQLGWGGTDQAWISHRASREEAHWTDQDGVYGHGRLGDSVEGAGTKLPDNARIVFFPGNRTQRSLEVLAKSPWIENYVTGEGRKVCAPILRSERRDGRSNNGFHSVYPVPGQGTEAVGEDEGAAQTGARKYVGKVASGYDAKRESSEKWKNEDRLVREFLADLPIGTTVLDVPVGTGRFIPLYEERGFLAAGLDLSSDMLKEARKKVSGNTTYLGKGDARKLHLPDASVDVALCIRLFRWLDRADVVKVLQELQRVASKRIIFNIRLGPESHPKKFDMKLLDEALHWKVVRQSEIVPGFWMFCCEPK